MGMENNNYKKTANSIIKNTIDGFESYIVLLFLGFGEVISMAIIGLPIFLLLDHFHSPMLLQWIFAYVLVVIGFLFWSAVGWTQSKFIGMFMTIMNIVLLVLMIISNK